MPRTLMATITEGTDWIYTADEPEGCKGCHYRLHAFIIDVPSYQRKVLVEAMEGPDKGLLFSTTPWNFSTRYAPVPTEDRPDDPPPPDKQAGSLVIGSGA